MLPTLFFYDTHGCEQICSADHFPADRLGPWLSAVVDACLDSVLVIDDIGQIVLANPQAGDLFCDAPQDLLGRSLDTMLAPDDWAAFRASLNHLACKYAERRHPHLRTKLQCARRRRDKFTFEALISSCTLRATIFFSVAPRPARIPKPFLKPKPSTGNAARQRAIFSHRNHGIEKRRFSRVLYDDLGQILGALKLDTEGLEQSLSDHQTASLSRVANRQSTFDGAINSIKEYCIGAAPSPTG